MLLGAVSDQSAYFGQLGVIYELAVSSVTDCTGGLELYSRIGGKRRRGSTLEGGGAKWGGSQGADII